MNIITDLHRLEGEDALAWQIRCCLAKKNGETDMDWAEIRDILGLSITPDQLRKQSVGIKLYDDYIKGGSIVATRILSISDTHYPFAKPLDTYKHYIGKVDILQLNGDIFDHQGISRFPKTYRISPVEELIGGRQYIIDLINMIRPKKVVANFGNHEARWSATLCRQLDNEMQEFMPETVFDYIFVDGFTHYDRKSGAKVKYEPLTAVFPDVEIDYTGTWWSQIGSCIFCHPKAYASSPLKTAEKALYWFRNEAYIFRALILAHTHRIGSYNIGNSQIYEQGCCCETKKMNYNNGMLINSQKEGFLYLCLDSNGEVIDKLTKQEILN